MRRLFCALLAGGALLLPMAARVQASSAPKPACSDGIDNDGDGLVDFRGPNGDNGCTSPLDDNEADASPIGLAVPPNAHVDLNPPLVWHFTHSVTIRNDGLRPMQVRLAQTHQTVVVPGPGLLMMPVMVSPTSTTQGTCTQFLPGVDFACDLGMLAPGAQATVALVATPMCGPGIGGTFDVTMTTTATAGAETNTASTTYNVFCAGGLVLPGPVGPPGLP